MISSGVEKCRWQSYLVEGEPLDPLKMFVCLSVVGGEEKEINLHAFWQGGFFVS